MAYRKSNVKGLYVIGALIGYPLIKQAINQGYEVVEHIIGNPVDPADQVIIQEVLKDMGPDANASLDLVRTRLRLFADLSSPQFREMIGDSTLHVMEPGATIFEKNDYTDTGRHDLAFSVGGEKVGLHQ